jgi:hypothetical protein
MDRAVSQLDFRALAGKTAYLDSTYLKSVVDSQYLISAMRQHMLASGCVLRDKKEEADYIVEIRAGAIGTDRHELLYGVPATEVPSVVSLSGVPRAIPEMPLVKKTEQRGVARIAVFAYNSTTGRPVWQSGVIPIESNAKDLWVLGAGPFQRGTIYDGTKFAGDKLNIPLIDPMSASKNRDYFSVADEAYFSEPVEAEEQVADTAAPDSTAETKVVPASTQAAAPPKEPTPSQQEEPAKAPAQAAALPKESTPSQQEESPKEPNLSQAAATPEEPASSQAATLPKAPTPCQVESLPKTPAQAAATEADATEASVAPAGDAQVSPAAHTEAIEEKK